MSLYRSLAYNFRQGGGRQLLRKGLWRARQWIESEASWLLYRSRPVVDAPEINGRPLDFDELKRLGYFKALAFPEMIRSRLAKCTCYGFFVNTELATVAWTWEGYLELEPGLGIPVDGIAIFDCWTIPKFRGRGIYTASLMRLAALAGERGATIAVDPGNIPSIRGIERAGFEPYLALRRRRRLGVTSLRIEKWTVISARETPCFP
jgi:GNAT superfamily N-acetyltransferase